MGLAGWPCSACRAPSGVCTRGFGHAYGTTARSRAGTILTQPPCCTAVVAERGGMTEDEAAAKIAAGMKGLHTRSELAKGNAERFADGERGAKIAARNERIAAGTATEEDKAVDDAVRSRHASVRIIWPTLYGQHYMANTICWCAHQTQTWRTDA